MDRRIKKALVVIAALMALPLVVFGTSTITDTSVTSDSLVVDEVNTSEIAEIKIVDVGNGTDIQAKILDLNVSARAEGMGIIPYGTYEVSSSIDLCPHPTENFIILQGSGHGTQINWNGNGNLFTCEGSSSPDTIVIRDIKMFGTNDTDSYIYISSPTRQVELSGLRFEMQTSHTMSDEAAIWLNGSSGQYFSDIRNIMIKRANYGIRFSSGTGGLKNGNYVSDVYCLNVNKTCLEINDGVANTFAGIYVEGQDINEEIIKIESNGNYISGIKGDSNKGNVTISGNKNEIWAVHANAINDTGINTLFMTSEMGIDFNNLDLTGLDSGSECLLDTGDISTGNFRVNKNNPAFYFEVANDASGEIIWENSTGDDILSLFADVTQKDWKFRDRDGGSNVFIIEIDGNVSETGTIDMGNDNILNVGSSGVNLDSTGLNLNTKNITNPKYIYRDSEVKMLFGSNGDITMTDEGHGVSNFFQYDKSADKLILGATNTVGVKMRDDLDMNYKNIVNFTVENKATLDTCNSTYSGKIQFNTTDNEFYGCDGTNWEQLSP